MNNQVEIQSHLSGGIKVLLVEDDDAYASLLSKMLKRVKSRRFITDRVNNLKEAVDYISNNKIDVILLDLHLPDGHGLDTLDFLCNHSSDIPIVVLTSLDDESVGIRALQKGAQDYIVKANVTDDLLSHSLSYAIERHILLTELKQNTQALKASEERFRCIAEHNVDAIVVVNCDGIAYFVNPAAELLFDCKADEFLGKVFDFPIKPGTEMEVEIRNKLGQPIIAELRATNIEWQGQDVCLLSLRDITERKQAEKVKEGIISIVSHELRSPLTSILNSLSLIADGETGEISEQTQKMVRIAFRSSERLLRLANDMLDIGKIESGKMEFYFQIYELMPLVEQSIEANRAYVEQFKVKIILDNSISDPRVRVDSDRLMQILTNLITNAAKFSPTDSEVRVSISRYDNSIRIAVKDQGPGIPEDFRHRIFDKFAQAQMPGIRRRDGAGLGLSIAKMLVEHMGGSIGFETEINAGTTFYFSLPEYHDDLNNA